MKKLLKSWTLWMIFFGGLVLLYNLTGRDDKNIIMVGLNPLLSTVFNTSAFCIAAEEFSYVWHLLSILSMILYGLALDGAVCVWKKKLTGAWYILAAILTTGFFMELVKDYVLYTATLNSAPFSLWAAMDGILFLLPAGISALIGWRLSRKRGAERGTDEASRE